MRWMLHVRYHFQKAALQCQRKPVRILRWCSSRTTLQIQLAREEMDRGPQETKEGQKSGLMYATAVTLRKRAIFLTSLSPLYEV